METASHMSASSEPGTEISRGRWVSATGSSDLQEDPSGVTIRRTTAYCWQDRQPDMPQPQQTDWLCCPPRPHPFVAAPFEVHVDQSDQDEKQMQSRNTLDFHPSVKTSPGDAAYALAGRGAERCGPSGAGGCITGLFFTVFLFQGN